MWIEITRYDRLFAYCDKSPSSQRVWIEIGTLNQLDICSIRRPLHRGCGLKSEITQKHPPQKKSPSSQRVWIEMGDLVKYVYNVSCRPLHRGCGLKSENLYKKIRFEMSPSSQRVWIEIKVFFGNPATVTVALFTEGVD